VSRFKKNLAIFVTLFSRFRSHLSGNTSGQHDTLKIVTSRCKL